MMLKQESLKISVVIPTYNMAQVIGDTIKSVLNQSYGNFEIIVQDNDSQDGTREVVSSFSDARMRYFKNDTNVGYAKNLIAGKKNCTGDILYFLGADDILSKKALQETAAAFTQDENIGAVTRPYFWFQGSTEHTQTPIRVTPTLEENEVIDIRNIRRAVYAMHNEILGQLSGLAFRMKYLEDSFFTEENDWIAHGYPFLHVFKKHPVVFLKNHQVAVRIGANTIRQKGNTFYNISPTKRWIEMLDAILYEDEFRALKAYFIKKIIASNYVGLVQIKAYGGMYFLLREISSLLRYKISNILDIKFWFFSLGSIVVPASLLGKMADYYKNRINGIIMEKIYFEYDLHNEYTVMNRDTSQADKKKIIFTANLDTGQGMSGGSRIYFELLKKIPENMETFLFGSRGTIERLRQENLRNITFIETDIDDNAHFYSIRGVLKHFLKRLGKGVLAVKKNMVIINQADYIYSVSDFYPDFFPAVYAKLKNKKIQWIAGYYLFAPFPFAKDSPYKGKDRWRGFLYWLMQRPSYLITKHWADFVLVTSDPDIKRFITKKRKRDKIIVVQGGVDIAESEKYLQSGNIVPLEQRKYDACFVGRFHYQKGVVGLMDIWKKVCEKKKGARLAMIGNGSADNPIENIVKEKIKEYGLESNIDLLGFRDGQEKYEVFKQSKIMVHPAIYDSGGMAAAEGMAWGLPGVSYDLEALKTYYPKGMIKTREGNQEQFAENILKLLNDRDFYDATSKEAHDLIIEVWDWKKRAESVFKKLFI